jgi:hypothetical protein
MIYKNKHTPSLKKKQIYTKVPVYYRIHKSVCKKKVEKSPFLMKLMFNKPLKCTYECIQCQFCTTVKANYNLHKSTVKHNRIHQLSTLKIKKKRIPAAVKKLVWNTYIGEEIGKSKCKCCKLTDITQMSFHCGHIVAESKGGAAIVSNLKPICQNCNSSMGTQHMDEFMLLFN